MRRTRLKHRRCSFCHRPVSVVGQLKKLSYHARYLKKLREMYGLTYKKNRNLRGCKACRGKLRFIVSITRPRIGVSA